MVESTNYNEGMDSSLLFFFLLLVLIFGGGLGGFSLFGPR